MLKHLLPLTASMALMCSHLNASDALIKPGVRLAVINTPHIHALVPRDAAEKLRGTIARAEAIYVHMAKDAEYTPRRLILLVTDDVDSHNGFSTVVPIPIINVQLAPSLQTSFIFTGENEFERTLVHELAHHISNDVEPNGFRRTLSNIFGRILPNDMLSLLVAYLSVPAHVTMPSFWQEGGGQWAETVYANGPVWNGRGRDSLTHMVWRLDTAANDIPEPGHWRLSYHQWPYGTQSYLYGLAYTRYLTAAYGDRASLWQLIRKQQHRWAFAFNGGPEQLLGKDHLTMIGEARQALKAEQEQQLKIIRQQPVTTTTRLTPINSTVAAPAWLPDGRLFAAYNSPYADPKFVLVRADGGLSSAWKSAYAMSPARSTAAGIIVYSETAVHTDPWNRARVHVQFADGSRLQLEHERLLQPDVRQAGKDNQYQVTAVQLQHDGSQQLVLAGFTRDVGALWDSHEEDALITLPTTGIPWTPAFRPGHDELTWVETDRDGSRLLLAPLIRNDAGALTLGEATVLAQVPGRIIHPAWMADGSFLYFCADHSGVANAYRIDPGTPAQLQPVTNTIGGVVACVPSPDGKELAVVDYDHQGPYLARLPNNPAAWPPEVPAISLSWPAPLAEKKSPDTGEETAPPESKPALKQFSLPTDAGDATSVTVEPYHGLAELKPLFWTPTTFAVPEGGYGVVGFMADPAFTHVLIGGAGVGPYQGSPVGIGSWAYGGWPIDIGGVAWQSERSWDEQIVASDGNRYDYVENVRSAEVRLGHGLAGFRRRFQLYAAGGIAEYRPVHSASKKYNGLTTFNLEPFTDVERYSEFTLAYSDATVFPTSYTLEDGASLAAKYRYSGYGGELHREQVIGVGSYVWSFWPRYGQQLVLGGAVGWSDGDEYLQNRFSVGGTYNLNQLPRGYTTTTAIGSYLVGGTIAYRTPIWRPFHGYTTTPFANRQTVLEVFFDAAKASTDKLNGNGDWYRSVGGQLNLNMMVWELMFNPGIGVAQQLDGREDTKFLFSLGYIW